MKSLRITIFALITSSILIGCTKQLNQQPITEIPYEAFWKTADDAANGNAAIYSAIQTTFSNTFIDWGDARSDNFKSSGTGEYQVAISYNGLSATIATADWGNLYNTISRANLAIKYVPTINDVALTTSIRNNYLAQAYAIRAYMYFWAVRLWGDVPLRLKPYETIDALPNLARTNADTVIYNAIIPDLENALNLVDKKTLSPFLINTGSILSMLAEVYMWKRDYAKVIYYTDQLIGLKQYGLETADNLKDVYITATTKENIWTLNWNYLTDGYNGIGTKIGSNSNTSNFQIDVPLKGFEKNYSDIRRNLNYDTALAAQTPTTPITVIWKYYPIDLTTGKPVAPSRSQNEVKLPLYRWPDLMLLRAEALNWGRNDKIGAFNLVNQVRQRANIPTLDPTKFSTQLDVEWEILNERQLELFAEGKRWFDLIRTNRVIDVMDPIITDRQIAKNVSITGFSDSRKILWPISRTALNADPYLTQNPPYSK